MTTSTVPHLSSDEINQGLQVGADARRSGKGEHECPFDESTVQNRIARALWVGGWTKEDQLIKGQVRDSYTSRARNEQATANIEPGTVDGLRTQAEIDAFEASLIDMRMAQQLS